MAFTVQDLATHTVLAAFSLKGVAEVAPTDATYTWTVSDPTILALVPDPSGGPSATFTGTLNGAATITLVAVRGTDTVTGTLDVVVDLFPDSAVLTAV